MELYMKTKNIILADTYLDSIMLMSMSEKLVNSLDGVEEATAIMGSAANLELLKASGLLTNEGKRARPGDLVIAVRTSDEQAVQRVLQEVKNQLTAKTETEEKQQASAPKNLGSAIGRMPDATIALISVPGEYASAEAMEALESGRSVMLFSDNVSLDEEIGLKKRASKLGLMLMGPDCGTAIIGGVALGFANSVRRGPFGIVAASGTGIQEISTLLHKKGYGISHAIGTGGRDLSKEVGGATMLRGIEALERDEMTKVIIILSKPPDIKVANKILDVIQKCTKTYVTSFLNGNPLEAEKRNLPFAGGLEEAVEKAVSLYENREYIPMFFNSDEQAIRNRAKTESEKIGKGKYLRGLFSGGTLAEEAIWVISNMVEDIYSNVPLQKKLKLKNSLQSYRNTIIDLGEDEFTRGRPHPMIDFTLRTERIEQEAGDRECGVILLDVVLGYGAHPDPWAALAPSIERAGQTAHEDGRYISFIASVTGTEEDLQGVADQTGCLEESGVVVMPSNAQAARFSALILQGIQSNI